MTIQNNVTFETADLEHKISLWTPGNPTRTTFFENHVNWQNRPLIQKWLILNGLNERKLLTAPSNKVLANAYRVGAPYIRTMNEEDNGGRWRTKGKRGTNLLNGFNENEKVHGVPLKDLLGLGTEAETSVPTAASLPNIPPGNYDIDQDHIIQSGEFKGRKLGATQPLDTAAIARAAEAVIGPRLDAAKKELERSNHQTIASTVDQKLAEAIKAAKISDTLRSQILNLVTQTAKSEIERLAPPRKIEVTNQNGTTVNVGRQHELFPTLLRLVTARGHNNQRLNIWLTGPTGSGKTTAAEKVAEALAPSFTNYRRNGETGTWELIVDGKVLDLGLAHSGPFGADSSLDADYKLIGHKNASGEFQWTTFLRIFCFGGVYVMDEIDNWMPSALVAANAPLANGWVSTPNGMMQRHPDCCIIAAANTWGTGATNDYVGRTKLDAATTNRFPNKLYWPIDESLERAIANDMGGLDWCDLVQQTRRTAKDQGLQVIFSPRNTFEGISLLKVGFSLTEVINLNLAAGLKPEQVTALGLDKIKETPISKSEPQRNGITKLDEFVKYLEDGRKVSAIRTLKETTLVDLRSAASTVEAMLEGAIDFPTYDNHPNWSLPGSPS